MKKIVLIALKRCPYYAGIWGAQVASLGGPALRHFCCLRQRASSVRVRMFFVQKNLYFLKEDVVSRFSKDMYSQLGSGWCRRALRDAPRWRQKRQKGSKISLAPHGGQAKNVKRYVKVGEWICSTYGGIYDKNRWYSAISAWDSLVLLWSSLQGFCLCE